MHDHQAKIICERVSQVVPSHGTVQEPHFTCQLTWHTCKIKTLFSDGTQFASTRYAQLYCVICNPMLQVLFIIHFKAGLIQCTSTHTTEVNKRKRKAHSCFLQSHSNLNQKATCIIYVSNLHISSTTFLYLVTGYYCPVNRMGAHLDDKALS